mmetsp:Transcript_108292/g.305298  ORF Transcript_108292/g.305298 Transcript_108292/m.305298 type:complete len:127 (-) Transcript_108292:95-475(-)
MSKARPSAVRMIETIVYTVEYVLASSRAHAKNSKIKVAYKKTVPTQVHMILIGSARPRKKDKSRVVQQLPGVNEGDEHHQRQHSRAHKEHEVARLERRLVMEGLGRKHRCKTRSPPNKRDGATRPA